MHWACAKITSSSAVIDEDLLKILVDKVINLITYKKITYFSNNFEFMYLLFLAKFLFNQL